MKVISKEEAIKYCDNIINDSEEGHSITNAELIKSYINTPKLDGNVEEAIERTEITINNLINVITNQGVSVVLDDLDTIRQALSDKDRQLNQIREYVKKWKDSKCVHPDANVLAEEILENILGDDNNE